MVKTTLKILKKGEEVISAIDNNILIKRKDGTFRVVYITKDENGRIEIDEQNSLEICYGNGEIEINDEKEDIIYESY